MSRLFGGRKALLLGSIAVAALVAGGLVYATIPSSDGLIQACYSNGNGRLRVIDAEAGETCGGNETALSWNQIGAPIYMNRNFQALPLAPFPGVTTAHLNLPPGSYMMWAKFRYRGTGTATETASCVFQGSGIGGLDSSQNNVPPGGEVAGQIDGFMMDMVQKGPASAPDVHVQCFGPPDVQIINTQFVAIPTGSLVLNP
jgi:hypothetical protein